MHSGYVFVYNNNVTIDERRTRKNMTVVKRKNGQRINVYSEAEHRNVISRQDVEMDERAAEAVHSAIKKANVCRKPVAKYDAEKKRAYLEYEGGLRKYVE